MILTEGNVEIDFGGAMKAWKPEEVNLELQGMSKVDFVAEYQDYYWLVEVKDFQTPKKLPKYEARIREDWVPKARDTYTYIHLMAEDTKPIHYIVIAEGVDKKLFPKLTEYLESRIVKEADRPWVRRYVQLCLVMDIAEAQKQEPILVSRFPGNPDTRKASAY